MNFSETLRSEIIKVKRTSLLYFTFLAAAFTPVVMLLDNLDGTPSGDLREDGPLYGFYVEGFQFIAIMFLPLFIVLVSTLLMQIEHKNNTWKQVLASPQPLHNILLSKFLVVQGMVLLMLVIFNLLMVLVAAGIDRAYPEFKLLTYLNNPSEVFLPNAKIYLASLGMNAFQFWLALRFRNFVAPLAIGLMLWLICPIALFELHWVDVMKSFPHALSIIVVVKNLRPIHLWVQWLSIGYMLLFFALAYLDFRMRKVKV